MMKPKSESGVLLCNHTNERVPYSIHTGINKMLTLSLDADWSAEKAIALKALMQQYPGDFASHEEFLVALSEYGLTDMHWNWLRKAAALSSSEYQWFYLIAENKVQGVCIVFHPKPSREDGERIFYVDYIAAAYWNRDRPGQRRRFSGVGRSLIRVAVNYAIEVLRYRPGFSLHSLAGAEVFYAGLGMTPYECDADKEGLRYFEANKACAMKISEVADACY